MTATATAGATRAFAIDKSHSEVMFQVRHLVTRVRGRFSDFEGALDLNEAEPEKSSVRFSVNVASIDTNESQRDQHLRSADFFHADEHPTLTFASTKIVKKSDDLFDVTGNLAVRGVTREITVPVSYLGKAKDPWGNEKVGFEAETRLNRKDFGLNWNAVLETGGFLVGDDVTISVSLQAVGK